MKIIIAGCSNVGITSAKKLISENHDLILIDANEKILNILRRELDAILIEGDILDINIFKKIEIQNSDMFIAVTDDDNTNILSSMMAKKLNPNIITIARVKNSYKYFNNGITYTDFSIDNMIDPKNLSIRKIFSLIEKPEAIEIVEYLDKKVLLVGVKIDPNSEYKEKKLSEIVNMNEIFKDIRVVAIYKKNGSIEIPSGNYTISENDKVFFIGKREIVEKVMKLFYPSKIKFKNIIILGANDLSENLIPELLKIGKNVTIIEEDIKKCETFSQYFGGMSNIEIINGYGTDESILNQLNIENSCFISTTDDDEYNIISAGSAKNYKAAKTIALIHKMALLKIVNTMTNIDAVFSPNILSVGQIISYCRTKNSNTVSIFSEINAETINITLNEKTNILGKSLQDIKFPKGIIIGTIIRDEEIIIPTGNDVLLLNDKLIIFFLPEAFSEIENIFSKKFSWRAK